MDGSCLCVKLNMVFDEMSDAYAALPNSIVSLHAADWAVLGAGTHHRLVNASAFLFSLPALHTVNSPCIALQAIDRHAGACLIFCYECSQVNWLIIGIPGSIALPADSWKEMDFLQERLSTRIWLVAWEKVRLMSYILCTWLRLASTDLSYKLPYCTASLLAIAEVSRSLLKLLIIPYWKQSYE